ncbi:MAG: Crp/Fnr family transcriptional regulator [Bdellovibrionaceae bacterium]|nr:Crp/Fnr family transcriptional regulator [Pseudobdellovibrionaceae bacterium]
MAKHHSHQDCDVCPTRAQNPVCSVDGALSRVQDVRTTSRYSAGQVIFYAGNDPLGLFTVQTGLVKLEALSPEGDAHTLRLMGPGCILGYRALFASEPYRATAIAVEDSQLCFIPKTEMLKVFEEFPAVAMNLAKQLSVDLRRAEEKWVQQIDHQAPSRIAEALLFLTDHFSTQSWTRREIAEWAGTTPETVMRTLSTYEKQGLIALDGKSIRILSRPSLSEKAHRT